MTTRQQRFMMMLSGAVGVLYENANPTPPLSVDVGTANLRIDFTYDTQAITNLYWRIVGTDTNDAYRFRSLGSGVSGIERITGGSVSLLYNAGTSVATDTFSIFHSAAGQLRICKNGALIFNMTGETSHSDHTGIYLENGDISNLIVYPESKGAAC